MSSEIIISHSLEIITVIGMIFTIVLIIIILTKTPKTMKSCKTYLLIYAYHSLLLEFSCGIYGPVMLHPCVCFYPSGIAKYLSYKITLMTFALSFFATMGMFDCSVAIILERYFAMKNVSKIPSNIPSFVYYFLTGISLCYITFMFSVIFYQPFFDYFFVRPEEKLEIIKQLFGKLDANINIDLIIVFRNTEANLLPPIAILLSTMIGFRVILVLSSLVLNAVTSFKLKPRLSQNLQKHSKMLIRMIQLQFLGISLGIIIPITIFVIGTLYVTESNETVSFCFTVVNCFGFYDSIITAICIKPYRAVFTSIFKFCRKKKVQQNN